MRKHSTGKKKQKHHVFMIFAHGALKTDLINIDTEQTNYYDFAKELQPLVAGFNFSEFTNYSVEDAVHFIKQNRGVPIEDGIVKFTNIVDKNTTERYGYIFDRYLWMSPFITNHASIIAGVLNNNDPQILKVGVYEVNPEHYPQPTSFTPLSKLINS